jgi:hypothetical protein
MALPAWREAGSSSRWTKWTNGRMDAGRPHGPLPVQLGAILVENPHFIGAQFRSDYVRHEPHGLNTSSVFGPSPALQLPLRAGRLCYVAAPSKNDAWWSQLSATSISSSTCISVGTAKSN